MDGDRLPNVIGGEIVFDFLIEGHQRKVFIFLDQLMVGKDDSNNVLSLSRRQGVDLQNIVQRVIKRMLLLTTERYFFQLDMIYLNALLLPHVIPLTMDTTVEFATHDSLLFERICEVCPDFPRLNVATTEWVDSIIHIPTEIMVTKFATGGIAENQLAEVAQLRDQM